MRSLSAALAATALLATTSSGQRDARPSSFPTPGDAELDAFLMPSADTTAVVVRVRGAEGHTAMVIATPTGRFEPTVLGVLRLEPDGDGGMSLRVPNELLARLPAGLCYDLAAVYNDLSAGVLRLTAWQTLMLGTPVCELLGFNQDPLGTPLVAGEEIAEQFAPIGLHVSAVNRTSGHPDKVIVFDSSNVTGEDDDLMTPGPGVNNTLPLNNLLIVAEDDVDLDGDGLVDDPDDEEEGGVITFAFDDPVSFCAIRIVDLDDGAGSEMRFFRDGMPVDTLALSSLGDNSVTVIAGLVELFDTLEVDLTGSGAIANFAFVFCPTTVGFDTFSSGLETGLEAGEVLTDQLASIGLHVSATNAIAGHPDQAILFDSSAPTGEDDDLMTPGPGVGNDVARGLVLILAEDAVDGDGDGLVDDPDDEQHGGVLALDFDASVTFRSATVLDVDTDETSFFVLLDGAGAMLAQIPLASLGDNSSQTVTQDVAGVRRVELHLGGSGALAELQVCPEVQGS